MESLQCSTGTRALIQIASPTPSLDSLPRRACNVVGNLSTHILGNKRPATDPTVEWLGPETSAVTAAGSGRREGRPDLLNPAGDGKASAGTSVLLITIAQRGGTGDT